MGSLCLFRFTLYAKRLARLCLPVPRWSLQTQPLCTARGWLWAWWSGCHSNRGSGRYDVRGRVWRLHRQWWLLYSGGSWNGHPCESFMLPFCLSCKFSLHQQHNSRINHHTCIRFAPKWSMSSTTAQRWRACGDSSGPGSHPGKRQPLL